MHARVRRAAAGVATALLLSAPAGALVVDAQDPEVQEQPPPRDPGWENVGRRGGTSTVYLGDGWVITARHSGIGPVLFGDASHEPVPGSDFVLRHPETGGPSDLLIFRVEPAPDLPPLQISRTTPPFGTRVLYIAWGLGRGDPTTSGDVHGFSWRPGLVRRWGTNRIHSVDIDVEGPHSLTRCFRTDFSRHGTRAEAQGATGDSGGAAFVRRKGQWKLAGILLSIGGTAGQEDGRALFGNFTNSADLSYYRKQIRAVMAGKPGSAPPGAEPARETPPAPARPAPGSG